jgi:hypothetical protein
MTEKFTEKNKQTLEDFKELVKLKRFYDSRSRNMINKVIINSLKSLEFSALTLAEIGAIIKNNKKNLNQRKEWVFEDEKK